MEFKGWVRTSLIDFPEHIATVLFTARCNFRCPPCHNADLVLHPEDLPTLPENVVWEFLQQRAGRIDGVVLTGGEPTIDPNLASFLRRLREHALDIKVDTNGYRPDVLGQLLSEGLLDYAAVDLKAPPAKYPLLCGLAEPDLSRLERSLALLQDSGIDYEFRTTVVPHLLEEQDIEAIARWIAGARRYVLQQFRPQNTLDPHLREVVPYPIARLQAMAQQASRWVREIQVREQ